MKRVLLLAVVAVMLCTVPAMAVNSIVIPDQSFATGATGAEIPIFITNDVAVRSATLPLIFRDVNPGAYPLTIAAISRERLAASLTFLQITQFFTTPGTQCGGGWGLADTNTLNTGDPITVSANPSGLMFSRVKLFDPSLPAGADAIGSFLVTVDLPSADGTFEVDSTCTDPANRTQLVSDANVSLPLTFTKGTITVGTGGGSTNEPPVAACQDISVDADTGCQAFVNPAAVDGGSTDDSDQGSLTFELVPPGPYALGANAVSLIVTDTEGAADTCSATITVEDNTPPFLFCNFTLGDAGIGQNCEFALPDYTTFTQFYVANDICPGLTLRQNPAPGTIVGLGTHDIYLVAEDAAGNKDSCLFQQTVFDGIIPTLTGCPADTTVECLADVPAPAGVQASDNCPGVQLNFSETGGTPCGGVIERMWVATDGAGNADTCIQLITVDDTEAPVATCPGNINQQEDSPGNGAVVNFSAATATDNCDGDPTITQVEGNPSGSTFAVGIHTISFEAMDDCGNADTCSFTVEVTAGTPDVIAVCQDVTVDADGNCEASVAPADVNNGSSGHTTLALVPGGPYALGVNNVQLIASNDQGDADTCDAMITVEDNTPPVLNCGGDYQSGNGPGTCEANVQLNGWSTATDNCDTDVDITYDPPAGAFPVGITQVTVIATDDAGNADTCEFAIEILDDEFPTITCPADITVFEDVQGGGTAVVNYAVTTSDNCPGEVLSQIDGLPSGSAWPVGTSTNTFVVTDAAGNADTCSFTIDVNPLSDELVARCQDVTVDADEKCFGIVTPEMVDNGSTGYDFLELDPPGPYPLGQTPVLLIAGTVGNSPDGDPTGNTADTCEALITVEDNTPPTINCNHTNDTIPANEFCEAMMPLVSENGFFSASDNCSGGAMKFFQNPVEGTPLPLGENTVYIIAEDEAGNKDSCSYIITVEDQTPPTITCPDSLFLANDQGTCDITADPSGVFDYSDNCGVTNFWISPDLSVWPVGYYDVWGYAEDAAGNIDSCLLVICVEDTELPVIACPGDINIDVACGENGATVLYKTDFDDNCPGATLVCTPDSGSFFPLGTTDVVCVVTDAAGNQDSCTFKVTVNELSAPDLIVTPDTLCFYATQNGPNPDSQCVSVQNAGCGDDLFWYTSPNAGWISTDPTEGLTDGEFCVFVELNGTGPGTYYGKVYVNADIATGAKSGEFQDSVCVKLVVEGICDQARLDVIPDTLCYTFTIPCVEFKGDDTVDYNIYEWIYIESDIPGCELGWTGYWDDSTFIQSLDPDQGVTSDSAYLCINPMGLPPGEYFECIQFYQVILNSGAKILADDEVCIKIVVEEGDCCDPILGLDSTYYKFYATVNQPAPAGQFLNIYDAGNDCDKVGFPWIATNTMPWLSYSDSSGVAPSSVTLFVDHSGLPVGEYFDTVWVDAPAQGAPGIVLVELCVLDEPVKPEARVWVTDTCGYIGDTVSVCVNFCNNFEATGISAGLMFEPASLSFIGGDFTGSRVEFLPGSQSIFPDGNRICISAIAFDTTLIDTGCGKLATLYFVIEDDEGCGFTTMIDSTSFFPVKVGGCELLMTDANLNPVYPSFAPGSIEIKCEEDCILCGVVRDVTGALIPGVAVDLQDSLGNVIQSTLTDANGTWCFTGLTPDDKHFVHVDVPGFCDYLSQDLYCCPVLTTGVCPPIEIVLEECPDNCILCGDVRDVTGAPMAGVEVELVDSNGAVIETVTTDSSGNWCFEGLTSGDEYFVNVLNVQSYCDYRSGILYCCEQLDDNLCVYTQIVLEECPDECGICLYVLDPSGAPCNDATVEIWSSYPDGIVLDTRGGFEFGEYCFTGLMADSTYTFRILKDGFCPQVVKLTCDSDRPTLTLDPLPTVPVQPYGADWYSQNATIDGVPVVPGDVIVAMDPDGVICGVTTITTPGEYLIHVIGDDLTTDPDEGAMEGDEITLYYNCECPLLADSTWRAFASYQFDAAFDCGRREIEIPLCETWTLISFNVLPPSPLVGDVLQSIDTKYRFLYSASCNEGNVSWANDRPINDLEAMDPCHGYWVLATEPNVGPIVIEGTPVDVDKPLNLCEGWNVISYLPNEWDGREHALASIDGDYDYLFTAECDGIQSWSAERPKGLNDLECMKPTKGYWIRMTTSATQTYPLSGYECVTTDPNLAKPVNLTSRLTTTNRFGDFWSATDVNESGLRSGDHITAKTTSGMIVGEAVVNDKGWFLLHVYGDDMTTSRVDGAGNGEELTFEVNGMAASVSGNTRWNEQQSSEITVMATGGNPLPTDYALMQNYPNPFNPSTTIEFRLPEASQVNLTIYNVLGQQVRALVAGVKPSGNHTIEWDGRDDNGSTVQSGMYFYRLQTPSYTDSRKMTLLK